ncbi:MAG: DUF4147 domain-containing protein [Candidatus Burarchaeum sp.]|nr:DUF4147 domain-containing protein [Candidatus Burarchaeum sp.]MDO8339890.1 DUF4147 domain-containing protein [Candidatus Burarchaeum sp.]
MEKNEKAESLQLAHARSLARGAVKAAIAAANPRKLVRRAVLRRGNFVHICGLKKDLSKFNRVLVLGAGKASGAMAEELERLVPVSEGAVSVLRGTAHTFKTKHIELLEAGHPRPDEGSVRAAERMLELARSADENTLVFCLISGGGSALMSLPANGLTIDEKADLSIALMRRGANIQELNSVRRHLSRIKGGGLARALAGAHRTYSLIISDVVGNELASIASGPTAADSSTYADAEKVLRKYSLWAGKPLSILEQGLRGEREETLKRMPALVHGLPGGIHNFIIGSNRTAVLAACNYLSAKKVHVRAMTEITGEARTVGARLGSLLARGHSFCAGGETTVVVKGKGKGGRNQELALAAALKLTGKTAVLASVGTDGQDGASTAAGAIVDGRTIERAKKLGLDARAYLQANDSNSFFKKLGDEIITGSTGTNVNDLVVGIALRRAARKSKTR